MADFAEVDSGFGAPVSGAFTALLGWSGALMSVALVAGLGVWGYQLVKRDVSGVPVVRALEGPMRVQPEDPGGAQAAHQGLAVNMVAAEGAAEKPADRLILAPEPLDLSAEDLPRPTLSETAPEVGQQIGQEAGQDTADLTDMEALAEQLAANVAPLDALREEIPLEGAELDLGGAAISSEVAGVSISPWPAPRPIVDMTALAIATEVALTVATPVEAEVDPKSVPAGTRLVQFGAYDSPQVARDQWEKLSGRFGDFMTGKQRIVQEAVSGGKTFYRLRAMGFQDINDARRFCAALVAERQACIPVVVR